MGTYTIDIHNTHKWPLKVVILGKNGRIFANDLICQGNIIVYQILHVAQAEVLILQHRLE